MKISDIKEILQTITIPKDIPYSILQDERVGVQNALKSWYRQYNKQQTKQKQHDERLVFERQLKKEGYQFIAGIDEVGRGPLAGPVVAACVIMREDSHLLDVNDSKQISLSKRDELYDAILNECVAYGVGIISHEVIDEINIYEATKLAMQKAVDNMVQQPDYLLIDAMKLSNGMPQQSLIKGDSRSYSIACASIIAKVTRDRMMSDYAKKYPKYDFDHNAGYGTKKHLEALYKYGVTEIHRKTFEPIKSLLNEH